MALSQAQKDALVSSGQVKQYTGKSWDEVEKILNQPKLIATPVPKAAPTPTALGTDGQGWYITADGKRLNPKFHDQYGNPISGGSNTSGVSENSYIDDLAQAKLKSTLSALDKSRSSQLGALSTEKATIKPYYQQAGLQARGQSAQGSRSFSEYLASRGLSSSGVAAQGEINRMGTLQGTLGNLGQQEVQAMSGIAQRESDVNNAYSSDVVSAKAGNQAEMLAAKIRQQELDRDREDKLRQEGIENELEKSKYADTKTANERSSFLDTIGQYSNDFTAQKNAVLNDSDPTNDWQAGYFAAEANKKRADAQAKYDKQGYVSEDIAKALGLPVGTMTQAYKEKQDEAKQKETVNNAIQMFGQLGYLTPQMAEILKAYGLPTDILSLQKVKSLKTGSSSGSKIPGVPSKFTN